jgi:hypothetical protein
VLDNTLRSASVAAAPAAEPRYTTSQTISTAVVDDTRIINARVALVQANVDFGDAQAEAHALEG